MKHTVTSIDPASSLEAQRNVNLMTNVVAKQCLLFGIAIIINQAFLTTVIVFSFEDTYTTFESDISHRSIQPLEVTVNVVVIWLILRGNYDKYICLCKCCHIGIAKCCFKNVDNESIAKNPYSPLLELQDPQSSNLVLK